MRTRFDDQLVRYARLIEKTRGCFSRGFNSQLLVVFERTVAFTLFAFESKSAFAVNATLMKKVFFFCFKINKFLKNNSIITFHPLVAVCFRVIKKKKNIHLKINVFKVCLTLVFFIY